MVVQWWYRLCTIAFAWHASLTYKQPANTAAVLAHALAHAWECHIRKTTSLTASEDEEHTEAATDVPMQMSLVSISSLAAKVRYAAYGSATPVPQLAQTLQDMRREVGA